MELLLNLIWITLAAGTFSIFIKRQQRLQSDGNPGPRCLLALACILLLLFPVVSVSDDLHPTQVLLEDANRRIQHFTAPVQPSPSRSSVPMLPALLALLSLLAITVSAPITNAESNAFALDGHRISRSGRAPPLF
jgi:hypothetical protein